MEQTQKKQLDVTKILQSVKRFSVLLLGSLFVQIAIWAIYSFLELNMFLCGISAIFTAMLYHGIQLEEETGLSRRGVFFATILTPFLMGVVVTVIMLVRYPDLSQTGENPLLQTISLYSARLTINGVVLLLFAFADSCYLRNRISRQASSVEETLS